MKTKTLPAIIMLLAGFVTCIVGIIEQIEIVRFTKILLLVLVIFYVLGLIIKMILDKNFQEKEKEIEETTEGSEEVSEEQEVSEGTDEEEEK